MGFAASVSTVRDAKFDRFTMKDGLSFDNCKCAVTDNYGFLWVGTYDGLNRYDGISFKVFRNETEDANSLSGNSVSCLFCGKDGTVWIGTNKGLCSFDYGKGKITRVENSVSDSLDSESRWILAVTEDSKGDVWFASKEGLSVLYKKTGAIKRFPVMLYNSRNWVMVKDLFEDSFNNFWVVCFGGIVKFNRDNGECVSFVKKESNVMKSNFNHFTCMIEDSRKNLWVGSWGDGLCRFNPATGDFTSYLFDKNVKETDVNSTNIINGIREDINAEGGQRFWVVGEGLGVAVFDLKNEVFDIAPAGPLRYKGLSTKLIRDIHEDKFGNLWLASQFGLYRYSTQENRFQCYKIAEGISDKNRFHFNGAFAELNNSGTLGLSCWGDGLFRWDRNRNEFTKLSQGFKSDWNNTVFQDADGSVWTGHSRGLEIYRNNKPGNLITGIKKIDDAFNENVFDIEGGVNGEVWVSTVKGLVKCETTKKSFVLYTKADGLTDLNTNKVFVSKDGSVWVCTNSRGLLRLKKDGGKFEEFVHNPADSNSIPSNKVLCITEDNNGTVWIGSSEGLSALKKGTDTFRNYSIAEGLSNAIVTSVLTDDAGRVWAATGYGVSVFDPADKSFLNLSTEDGLYDNYSSLFYRLPDNSFLIGYDGYADIFRPEEIRKDSIVHGISITSFSAADREIPLEKENNSIREFELPYKENSISINYVSPVLSGGKHVKYYYMLEGFDDGWVSAGYKRNASYTNLPPGKFTFLVKSENINGTAGESVSKMTFTIIPPFWGTLWFKTGIFLLVLGAAFQTVRRKVLRDRKEKLEQERFTRELIDSQENERKRIASELHDSIGQNLLIIKNKAALAAKSKEVDDVSKEKISEISELTSDALNEVRSISYNLRPYEIDRLGLTEALNSLIENISAATLIKAECEIENIDGILENSFEISIYRIFQEILNNIIKHSGADRIDITVLKEDKIISIAFSDNGKGFSRDSHNSKGIKGSGLRSIEERTKMMKGIFLINSEESTGTKINIKIPYIKI